MSDKTTEPAGDLIELVDQLYDIRAKLTALDERSSLSRACRVICRVAAAPSPRFDDAPSAQTAHASWLDVPAGWRDVNATRRELERERAAAQSPQTSEPSGWMPPHRIEQTAAPSPQTTDAEREEVRDICCRLDGHDAYSWPDLKAIHRAATILRKAYKL